MIINKNEKQISIEFGTMCDTIEKQLIAQGFLISKEDGEQFQKIANAITLLQVQSIISDSIVNKAEHNLLKKIMNSITFVETKQ